ncbi:hypothetical protein KM176_02550 [Pseudooceanicola sp. CBS1P-1]|uniref:Uncharacterized protein n=1 Tax=Pseudooceanicola albus TaxID=2692189 RepID=A0A6L7G1A0_9RHOB|nr:MULTISPECIES: hypothetical protein [Pseudooceanicola]MBT9382730.1 hypothetical protein [Pseudooceanicola endophyticus]MXN17268.1 hypothetical protein [Pseudooceanicola albus]
MRNAAMILGLIGGVMALVVGLAAYGYTAAISTWGEVDGLFMQVADPDRVRLTGLLVPIVAIAGAGMARARALWGGLLMLIGAVGFYLGYGVNFFTLFPIAFIAAAGIMAVLAGRPDEEKAHF